MTPRLFAFVDGLYVLALCEALTAVVVTPYARQIAELELELLRDHQLNVTYLQAHLETVSARSQPRPDDGALAVPQPSRV